jgi:hypothetical protein
MHGQLLPQGSIFDPIRLFQGAAGAYPLKHQTGPALCTGRLFLLSGSHERLHPFPRQIESSIRLLLNDAGTKIFSFFNFLSAAVSNNRPFVGTARVPAGGLVRFNTTVR